MTERAKRWVILTAVFLLGLVGGAGIFGMWRTEKRNSRSVNFSQTGGALPVRVQIPTPPEPEVAETNNGQVKETGAKSP